MKRSLTILNVAYPLLPVSFDAIGAAQQTIAHLDAGLVSEGHRSIVIACAGSRVHGDLVRIPRVESLVFAEKLMAAQEHCRAAIESVLRQVRVDVVHLHGHDFAPYLPPPGVPVLVTLHRGASAYSPGALSIRRPNTFLHGVSEAQQRAMGSDGRWLPPISHGVAVDAFAAVVRQPEDFVLGIGRIAPEKGFHLALEAAQRANVPMILAGEVDSYPLHLGYFRREVEPLLDEQRRFVGAVGLDEKRRLMSAARAVLVPNQVAEASSMVAMEAAACGTPVIATSLGALPDLIEPWRTGLLADGSAAMADAIGLIDSVPSSGCRVVARERFRWETSQALYFQRYHQLANGGTHRAHAA